MPLHVGAILLLAGCFGHRDVDVQIPFTASFGETPFSCSASGPGFAPFDLRLYVHDLTLVDAEGHAVPVILTDDGTWQNRGVALLDFESGSDNCAEGTAGTHTTLSGRIAAGDYRALQFGVGVPFDRNHADAATADAPLNLGRMHWGWQGGYKFLRFEGGSATTAFRFHLGSTGCEGTIGHITRCTRPNRARVLLANFVPGRDAVQIDLSTLIGAETGAQATSECMSEQDDPDCRAAFAALGLDLASGLPSGQPTLFRVSATSGERTVNH